MQARNFAVMTGVNAGISCVMKRIRGKEDVQSRYNFSRPISCYLLLHLNSGWVLVYMDSF